MAGKKAAEVAGKSGANRVLVKVEGKVAEGSAMIWTPSVEASSRTLSPGALGREFHSDLARFLRAALAPFFAESCARLFRQMRNRFLSPCSFGRFLNVPLRSGSLFSSCHNFT